ncbi:MAG: PEP-CTERM sorting domain-containing protein [Phycisphaeraceae bacterium]
MLAPCTRRRLCFFAIIVASSAIAPCVLAVPTVYTTEASFLAATTPDQTSDFQNLPAGGLGNPFSHEGVNYQTLHPINGTIFGAFVRSTPGGTSNHGLANNSTPDMTLTFDDGPVSAIGFYVTPSFSSAGNWEMTLTLTNGGTFVDNFSHDNSKTPEYRGYIDPAGIESIRIARPAGQASPNHRIDDLSLTFVPEPTSLALLGVGALLVARRRR